MLHGHGRRRRRLPPCASTKGCVNIFVERCQWYVQTEDTLIQVLGMLSVRNAQILIMTCANTMTEELFD